MNPLWKVLYSIVEMLFPDDNRFDVWGDVDDYEFRRLCEEMKEVGE